MLESGSKIDSFTISTDTGTFSMANYPKKKIVVFFFPRADTSGCTKEAIAFSSLLNQFNTAGCEVIGVSKDNAAKQAKFRAKHGLTCHLGADNETDICEKFGVWIEKSLYGKTYMGIQRATFIIGPDGKLLASWPKVKLEGHAEEVLNAVKAM